MMRRVVITGMGAVTPIGNTVEQLWKSVEEGKCGIEPITAFDTSEYRVKLAAQVKDLGVEQYFTKRDVKFNDRFTVFARVAAKQAIADSQLDLEAIDRTQLGVIVGSGIGGLASIENAKDNLNDKGPTRISPFFIPMTLINLAAGSVAIDAGANGHCSSIVTACAAGTDAIGIAFQKIRDGYATWMIAGGSEASITPLGVAGFMVMRALHEGEDPNHASIPFDENRSGFVMGEGSAIVILEELETALARKAKIYGEIVGYGTTCDANHITAPLEDGSMGALAMTLAIKDAKLSPENVDYINAHGTSTPLNDKTETLAVKRAFGEHAQKLMMSSTKSMTGHMLGASGAVEAIISIKALQEGFVPATINLVNQDPLCDLDVVANVGRKKDIKVAMSNSLGFGGHNASIVLKKWEG
jgi:3-oxoacyl-[acyl-carrier-protein] synthase II